MNMISSDPVLTTHRNQRFSSIANCRSRDLVGSEFQRNHRTAKKCFRSHTDQVDRILETAIAHFENLMYGASPFVASHHQDNMGA
jgi:hypothetical protein